MWAGEYSVLRHKSGALKSTTSDQFRSSFHTTLWCHLAGVRFGPLSGQNPTRQIGQKYMKSLCFLTILKINAMLLLDQVF